MIILKKLSRILNKSTLLKRKHLTSINCTSIQIQTNAESISDDSKTTLLASKTGKYKLFCIDKEGVKTQYEVSKSSFYHKLGLTVRDLRFHHSNMLFVRNRKIIMRFQNLKMIVSPDAIILIDPPFKNDEDGNNSLAELWKSMPSLLHGSVLYTNNLPLEYRALEAVFMHIQCEFSLYLSKLEPEITKLLSILTDPKNLVVDRSLVHILLKNNTKLNHFSTQLTEFCETIEEILNNEDDIRSFCISSIAEEGNRSQLDAIVFTPPPQEEFCSEDKSDNSFQLRFPSMLQYKYKINMQDEMESLLDSYLRDVEEINNLVKELKEAIDNSTTTILINLDSHRNLLLRFELELTIGMFSCTVFGLIGMAFGMNLTSALEESPLAFWCFSGLMFCGSGLVWRYLLNLSRKPLPSTNSRFSSINHSLDSSSSFNSSSKTEHKSLHPFADILSKRQRSKNENKLYNEEPASNEKIKSESPEYHEAKTIVKALKNSRRKRSRLGRENSNYLPFERMKPLGTSVNIQDLFNHPNKRNYSTSILNAVLSNQYHVK